MPPPMERLVAICPPPQMPVDNRGDWVPVEEALGFRLPVDFKAIVQTYGDGCFAEFLYLLHPFAREESCLVSCSARMLEADRYLAREFPDDYGTKLHPEPGGLFPWARTDNGNALYWATDGDPEGWTVVVGESRGPEKQAFPMGAADFLARWLEGGVQPEAFPVRDEYFDARFEPRRELRYLDVYIRFVEAPFEERLEPVREHLELATIRGVHRQPGYSAAQFRGSDDVTKVQYSDNAGHGARLNLLFPPDTELAWKARLRALRDATGWVVWRISDAEGHVHWVDLVNDAQG